MLSYPFRHVFAPELAVVHPFILDGIRDDFDEKLVFFAFVSHGTSILSPRCALITAVFYFRRLVFSSPSLRGMSTSLQL